MADRGRIAGNGWKQSSIVSYGDACKIIGDRSENEILVVISQDCDILHGCYEAEPYISMLRGALVNNTDGNLTFGKNPRKLQIPVTDANGNDKFYEFKANSVFNAERSLLEELVASQDHTISPPVTRQINSWLAARYTRFAMPDAFVARLNGIKDKIAKVLKSKAQYICGIYVAIKPMDELEAEAQYQVILVGSLQVEQWDKECFRKEAEEAISRVASYLDSCEGIEVLDHEVRSEADISLNDIRYLNRWDFDYMSFKGGELTPVPSVVEH